MLILGISIWAILSSAMSVSSLGTFSREELKAHSVATGLFETLETMLPSSFDADFAGTAQKAISDMGGNGNYLHGYKVLVDNIASGNGVRLVQVTLSTSPSSKKAPFVARKSISSLSKKTVDDAIDK
jgi:hypothetical protein